MKKCLIIFYWVIIAVVFIATAHADNNSKITYENQISKLISFYQSQLFLIDSEYTILSDIGKDAKAKIDYLKSNKENMILEMKAKKVILTPAKIKSFAAQKVHKSNVGLAYTPPQ